MGAAAQGAASATTQVREPGSRRGARGQGHSTARAQSRAACGVGAASRGAPAMDGGWRWEGRTGSSRLTCSSAAPGPPTPPVRLEVTSLSTGPEGTLLPPGRPGGEAGDGSSASPGSLSAGTTTETSEPRGPMQAAAEARGHHPEEKRGERGSSGPDNPSLHVKMGDASLGGAGGGSLAGSLEAALCARCLPDSPSWFSTVVAAWCPHSVPPPVETVIFRGSNKATRRRRSRDVATSRAGGVRGSLEEVAAAF